MRGAGLYGPRDVRFEDRVDPKILSKTDTVVPMSATCRCCSDPRPGHFERFGG